MKKVPIILVAIAALVALPLFAANDTLLNLQKAYNAEMNSRAQYLAFAQKADDENFGAVGSLFRAVAVAEESQANTHAKLIKTFNVAPKATIITPVVGTTEENVALAFKNEQAEIDTMYAPFIKTAKAEKRMESLQSFRRAEKAEGEHATLFSATIANLETLKGSGPVTYYVCPVCGEVTQTIPAAHCRDCGKHTADYLTVK